MSALDKQEGGSHYKNYAIQPVEFIHQNKLGFLEGCVIKRLCRWQQKDGIRDLRKAIHEIELLIELTEIAEKRFLAERDAREELAVKLGHPMTGDRMTAETKKAVQSFLSEDARRSLDALGQNTSPPIVATERSEPVMGGDPTLAGWVSVNLADSPPPASLPDGTVVYEWVQSAGQVRIGFMHRGQLVRDKSTR